MWLHGWFAGAAMVTPENSIAIFFDQPQSPWTLTLHGRKAAEVFAFMRQHDRGVPYTPVALVLDHVAGYNAYMDKPWGILNPTEGDREVRDLFDYQLFPGSDHIHSRPDPRNPEASYLRPTPYGEMFDVLLTSAPPGVLSAYPVILLAGDIEFSDTFVGELEKALRKGSRVLIAPRHRDALGADLRRLERSGRMEVLEPWKNPATGRPAAISNERLRRLSEQYMPISITGDAVQYQISRISGGWVVELINNEGVSKKPDQPAVIDEGAVARLRLNPRVAFRTAREWRSSRVYDRPGVIELELAAGAIEFVEFAEAAGQR
jgi:hypothetical protein